MWMKLMVIELLVVTSIMVVVSTAEDTSFIYNNGFLSANLTLDGDCEVTSNGLLRLTNETKQEKGHAFYRNPIVFRNSYSFSTTFVFAIRPEYPTLSGQGIAFVLSPTKALIGGLPSQYLGLFNATNNGDPKNQVFAVELDTNENPDFSDINNNHVGIDINGLESENSTTAGYYTDYRNGFQFQNLSLISGNPMQVWVDYDGSKRQISVTLAPINVNKPKTPLLTLSKDLSLILSDPIYVGFSSSTGSFSTSHYVLGWGFKINGVSQSLNISQLPKLPPLGRKKQSFILPIVLPLFSLCFIILASLAIVLFIKQKRKFSEVLEDWEQAYGPHRFKYKDLYKATKGFKEEELLGSGGFGRVYKGTMPISKIEVAVKRVSHDSQQGMREFIAEIASIGRLRHRNLVTLLGYCRRKGELFLVYEFMPNGSLDKYLYNQPQITLNWTQRFRIIKGVALGLCYLHEEWEQVVIHRDIKASNILLDSELNGRIGDFGLAKLHDHGSDPQTTRLMGTLGYLAPEHSRTRKATTMSDVFSFGAFLLEVVCGRRPIEQGRGDIIFVLQEWVYDCFMRGEIVEAKDQNLGIMGIEYREEEVELVLKLGLLCSNSRPLSRPSMRQVVQFLNGNIPLPDLSSLRLSSSGLKFGDIPSLLSSSESINHRSVVESLLSGGR